MQTKNSASSEIYALYYDKVFGYAMNKVRNRRDAEDITSEVFLKLFSKSGEFDSNRRGAASYIFKVMQTTIIDFYRKNNKRESLEKIGEPFYDDDDLDSDLIDLDKALGILTERELEIVVLHYYHGLSHKEISEKMRLSYSNVRRLCHVSIEKLRKKMNGKYGY